MMYLALFVVRFYPFIAIPLALILFELGYYHFNRRERTKMYTYWVGTAFFTMTSIAWIVFEGYWRAAPYVRKLIEHL